jgi:hypothetical protein
MARPDLRRRVAQLECDRMGAPRVVVIRARHGDDESFEREVARRREAGLIRPHDLIIRLIRFSDAPCPEASEPVDGQTHRSRGGHLTRSTASVSQLAGCLCA